MIKRIKNLTQMVCVLTGGHLNKPLNTRVNIMFTHCLCLNILSAIFGFTEVFFCSFLGFFAIFFNKLIAIGYVADLTTTIKEVLSIGDQRKRPANCWPLMN